MKNIDGRAKAAVPPDPVVRENVLATKDDIYMDLMLDDGFKRTFGEEPGKPLMLGLLRAVLPRLDIVSFEYIQNQAPHFGSDTKKSVYDVRCKLSDGTTVVVEVQRGRQDYFKDRVLYYGSMPISSQQKDGDGDEYRLCPVYVVSFVAFELSHGEGWTPKYRTEYRLRESGPRGDEMTDKLTFTFIELGRFRKKLSECSSFEEKLYFCMKYIHQLRDQPENLRGEYFDMLFRLANKNRLSADELEEYCRRMTTERDYRNQMTYAVRVAREEGYEEGIEKGAKNAIIEAAKAFKAKGTAADVIAACTGLSVEDVQKL